MPDVPDRAIGRMVRAHRKRMGWTQARLAEVLDLHRPAISEIEAGKRSLAAGELFKLADAFEVPVDRFHEHRMPHWEGAGEYACALEDGHIGPCSSVMIVLRDYLKGTISRSQLANVSDTYVGDLAWLGRYRDASADASLGAAAKRSWWRFWE